MLNTTGMIVVLFNNTEKDAWRVWFHIHDARYHEKGDVFEGRGSGDVFEGRESGDVWEGRESL